MKNNLVVVGCGNTLLSDDGIGIHVINELRTKFPDENIYDAGVSLFTTLLNCNPELIDTLIIIDALSLNNPPGTIYKFDYSQLKPEPGIEISLHDSTVFSDLLYLQLMGYTLNKITVFGIIPEKIRTGTEISRTLKTRIPVYIKEITKEINSYH